MKPPSRKRKQPQRFASREPEQKRRVKVRAGWFSWKWKERQVLLTELIRQLKYAELDLLALQAKLPKKSIEQIESIVQFLKTAVGKRVARLVNKLRRDKQSDKVPIELWTEMAQKMAGSQEAAISSAFSQMFLISATEPCSLLNSVPPRPLSTPKPLPSNLQKVPLRPMARPAVAASSTCITPMRQASALLSASQMPGSPSVRFQKGSLQSTAAEASPSIVNLPSSSQSTVPIVAATTLPKNMELTAGSIYSSSPGLTSPLPNNVPVCLSKSSCEPAATTPKPSQPAGQAASPSTGVSTQGPEPSSSIPSKGPISDQQTSPKTLNHTDFGVDFENIYRFLSCLNKQGNIPSLSPMESAVVLDLLLSLPEQIPLLNCVELQHHLRQVHDHLSAPVKELSLSSNTSQAPLPHLTEAGKDPEGPSLQRDISTIQEGGLLDQSASSMPTVLTGSTVSNALIESSGSGSSGMTDSLPQTFASPEENFRGQGDKDAPADQNNRVADTQSVSSSKSEAGFQPMNMDRNGLQDTTVLRTDNPVVGSPLQTQTAQQSTNKSNFKTIPTNSQNIEEDNLIFEKAGLCPLNPFVIPLKLLVRSEAPLSEG